MGFWNVIAAAAAAWAAGLLWYRAPFARKLRPVAPVRADSPAALLASALAMLLSAGFRGTSSSCRG
ncbi:hypothetical protein [Mangrovicoccus ximenensis]|uniref:hypothetical protein n=1 Tax=Mangrovicoccus ximenensis TaxID=1911570 RepID=UPI000D39C7B5|nr:hypothetical protein [Mangrovicoccus ximenensis]